MLKNFIDKGLGNWLPYYVWGQINKKKKDNLIAPIHIILCKVDHFEPFNGGVDFNTAKFRVKTWLSKYPQVANKHKDGDGCVPQHSWFYPPHHDQSFLEELVILCKRGYGEIEMHLHHNRMLPFPDTGETLRSKILKCINDYSKYKIFCLPDGTRKFGFIHGDWSLDNSRGKMICGVNNEINILKECGCYADFTFPAVNEAQPSMINKIYYVKDNPNNPKSYNWGKELEYQGKPWGDLLMIPGVIGLRWESRTHRIKLAIEASNIDNVDHVFPQRIDYLISNGIKIRGKPDWIFIKLHTHGAREEAWDSLLGEKAEKMFTYLEEKYNDGNKFILHYVTAREMYNIIKAAEAGRNGNPNSFRDFSIPQYIYLNKE